MLILTRKNDEEIVINSDIVIKILSISEGQVKLGISAPKEIEILRGEIYLKVKENNMEALKKSMQKISGLSNIQLNRVKESK
jgi:carbon storage regulator